MVLYSSCYTSKQTIWKIKWMHAQLCYILLCSPTSVDLGIKESSNLLAIIYIYYFTSVHSNRLSSCDASQVGSSEKSASLSELSAARSVAFFKAAAVSLAVLIFSSSSSVLGL